MDTQSERRIGSAWRRAVVDVVLITLAVAFVDQGSKWLVTNVVMQPPRVIPMLPFFNFRLGYNSGVSFGMFSDVFAGRAGLLAGIQLLIVAVLLIWACRLQAKWERFALAMIAGGALGNIADRLRQGAVTDFLDFHWSGLHWPTFNIADVAITLGVMVLLVTAFSTPTARTTT